jgi:hypothetical protein
VMENSSGWKLQVHVAALRVTGRLALSANDGTAIREWATGMAWVAKEVDNLNDTGVIGVHAFVARST